MTASISMMKLSLLVFRVFMMTTFKHNNGTTKMTEASASVHLKVATALLFFGHFNVSYAAKYILRSNG